MSFIWLRRIIVVFISDEKQQHKSKVFFFQKQKNFLLKLASPAEDAFLEQ